MFIYRCAVQYIFVTYFIHSSLYLSISCTNLAPTPPPYLSQLVITNLFSTSESISVLLYSFVLFLRFYM